MTIQLFNKLWPQFLRFPFRYYVMVMCAMSGAIMFATRCVINVALLAMVTNSVSMGPNGTQYEREEVSINSSESESISVINLNSAPIFNWNQAQQGIIIGSYYYSYTALQISTGFLADKFNVVKLGALSQLAATLITLLIPLAASTNYYLLVLVRIVLGLFHAPTFPCLYILFEKWFSPQEKAFAQAIMTVGTNVGVAIVMPVTAWLCENGFAGGWPSAFYSMAGVNAVFLLIWCLTITMTPNENSFISDDEKKFISFHVVQIPKRKVKVPWRLMFKSIPLWSVTIGRGICSLGYHTVNSKIPLYLETILGYKLQGNGLINSTFYLAEAAGQFISGPLSKYIATKGYLKLTVTRKLFESIALLGPAFFLLGIPLLSGRPETIVIGLICTMFTMGASSGGDIPIVPEMAPGLVGTVFGFANTFSCAAGFLAPMAIGAILSDQVFSESKWNIAFYFFGSIQVLGAILFAIFATSKPQSWALVENTTKTCKSNQLNGNNLNSIDHNTNNNSNNNDNSNSVVVAVEMTDKRVINSLEDTIENSS